MDAIKAEKALAMRRFRRLRQIKQLLRFVEAAAALLLLSYSSTHIPSAARISAQFLRRIASFLISPHFVFLLANAIVLALLKSPQFSSQSPAAGIGSICAEEEEKMECRENFEGQREDAGVEEVEEEGDDEEFRRMVEEFIEKQQRFRREESLGVLHG